ncbi:hypothetical protein F5B20DRAFT_536214 [Whalleya microplaca]|nr:hypothetical protein F5B20DRAFT_536214 [Whalleya microplaca]
MGLPLFVAPVEPDIPSKPAPKSPLDPATTRSPIRRADRDRRRQLHEIREHRLRMLAALQGDEDNNPLGLGSSRNPPRIPSGDADLGHLFRNNNNNPAYPLWDQFRNLHAEFLRDIPPHEIAPRTLPPPSYPLYPSQSGRTQRAGLPNPSRMEPPPGYHSVGASTRNEVFPRRSSPHRIDRLRHRPSRNTYRLSNRARYVDGLGDRDRSLSPEGDGVWDTLQATLTPDPQPPSVGSSFASTNASAAASQGTTAGSSNTSITSPDEEAEPPCDPVNENFDNDGEDGEDDEDVEEQQEQRIVSLWRPRNRRRSYADVAATAGPEWLFPPLDSAYPGLPARND